MALSLIRNHKTLRLFLKRAIACLDSFSISVSRLITYALFRESRSFVGRTVAGGFKCETYEGLYWRGWRAKRAKSSLAERASLWRGALFCLRGFCLARVVISYIPATRHVKVSSRKIVRESSPRLAHPLYIFPSLYHTFALCQLDLFLLPPVFFSTSSFRSQARIRSSNKVNSLFRTRCSSSTIVFALLVCNRLFVRSFFANGKFAYASRWSKSKVVQ